MTAPQLVHDKINLASLVKKLERSLTDEYWNEHGRLDKWITAQCTLQANGTFHNHQVTY